MRAYSVLSMLHFRIHNVIVCRNETVDCGILQDLSNNKDVMHYVLVFA